MTLDTTTSSISAPVSAYTRVRWGAALALVTLLALALRLYRVSYHAYWEDETISTLAARAPLLDIFTSISVYSIHPPLYFALLHLWVQMMGESLFVLRLLSVLISTACVPLIYALGHKLANDRRVALASATLLALAPFQIHFGQHARMYALFTLLVILTTLAFLAAWQAPPGRSGWRWAAYGLCVVAGCYTHVYFPFSVVALNVWALYDTARIGRIDTRRWSASVLTHGLAVALFLPFLPQLLNTTTNVLSWFWLRVDSPLYVVLILLSLSNNATVLVFREASLWMTLLVSLPALVAIVMAVSVSIRRIARQPAEQPAWLLLHCLLWVPIGISLLITLTIRPVMLERYLIGTMPALMLLLGWSYIQMWRLPVAHVMAGAYVLSCGAVLLWSVPTHPEESDLVQMVEYITEHQQPDDAVVYVDWQGYDTAQIIAPTQPNVYIAPGPLRWNDTTYWRERIAYIRPAVPPSIAPVAEFGAQYERVWLVLTSSSPSLLYHIEHDEGWLQEHGTLIESREFPGNRTSMLLYDLQP